MTEVLAIRPFVPSKEYAVSKRYYEALGFVATHSDDEVTILKMGAFSFILQNYYQQQFAENCMIQMLVRDADAWWQQHAPETLAGEFGLREPRAPAMQSWGLKVGFIFDPCGVLWHVAEVPF
jgi:hypothetical protein